MTVDLIVTPDQGRLTPHPDLGDDDARKVLDDWAAPARAYTGGQSWVVGFEHKQGNRYAITSTLTIPRTA